MVSTLNLRPVARAGSDLTGSPNRPLELDGRGSSDPNEDALTFAWSIVVDPSDGEFQSDPDTIRIILQTPMSCMSASWSKAGGVWQDALPLLAALLAWRPQRRHRLRGERQIDAEVPPINE